jgi:cytochrome c-type biogenesis protein
VNGVGLFSLAVASGMATALNPCGIGLLPAYLGHLGTRFRVRNPLLHALQATALMALAFVVVFTLLGMLIRLLGATLFHLAPGVSLLVAAGLLLVGTLTVLGRKPALLLPQVDLQGQGYVGATIAYGLSFAFCSISCTLPVFLSIALQATTSGPLTAATTFILFALGMALVILPISIVGVAMAGRLDAWLSPRTLGLVERVSGLVMLVSGLYLTWYWTIGPEHLLHG